MAGHCPVARVQNLGVFDLCHFSGTDMTEQPGHRTMEMNGGSSASYLARAPCVPLFSTLFNRGANRRAFRLPGESGDHFHCTVEPSPGHIRQERKRRINLRKIPRTPAGRPWDTRRDNRGLPAGVPGISCYLLEKNGQKRASGHRGGFQKFYMIFSYVPILLPNSVSNFDPLKWSHLQVVLQCTPPKFVLQHSSHLYRGTGRPLFVRQCHCGQHFLTKNIFPKMFFWKQLSVIFSKMFFFFARKRSQK